eukprot:4855655-Amphidinium_carterae.1
MGRSAGVGAGGSHHERCPAADLAPIADPPPKEVTSASNQEVSFSKLVMPGGPENPQNPKTIKV